MDKVRMAIIGCGQISRMNVPGYLEHPRSEVYALCDSVREKAEASAKLWQIDPKIYTNFEDVLNDPNVDAVELLTPHHLHEPQIIAALSAGKHVSCQKPLCNTMDEAHRIVEAASKASVKFRVTENFLYYPPILKAKELLDSGVIGEPSLVHCHSVEAGSSTLFEKTSIHADSRKWSRDPTLNSRGRIHDAGVHKYSTAMRWIGKDIGTITGMITPNKDNYRMELPAAVVWRFRNSTCMGVYEYVSAPQMAIRGRYVTSDDYFEIHGEKGSIHVTRCSGELRDLPPVIVNTGTGDIGYDVPSDWMDSFRGAATDFVDSIIHDTQPGLTAEFSLKTIQVALGIYESVRTGATIEVASIR